MRIVAIICSLALIEGWFISFYLIVYPILITIGVVNLIRAIYLLVKDKKGYSGFLLSGFISLVMQGVLLWIEYQQYPFSIEWQSSQRAGFILTLTGGLGLFASGW